jgi:hypothetical protein
MRVLTQFVWLSGLLVETTILVRSFLGNSFTKYSIFYLYISSVLATSIALYVVSVGAPQPVYARLYWPALFITLSLGYGAIVEVSRHVFAQHSSLDRLARWVAVTTYGTIFLLVATHAFLLPRWSLAANTADLERYLRMAEAVVLMAIVCLAAYYNIEMGKNLKGMVLGFGVYVGVSVLFLALRLFVGIQFSPTWKIVQSSSYLAALLIWAVALWSYDPAEPPRRLPPDDQGGYLILAGRTKEMLDSINEHLDRTVPR